MNVRGKASDSVAAPPKKTSTVSVTMGPGSVAVWAVASSLLLGDRVNSPTDRASRCESEVAALVRNVKTDSASTVFLRTKTKRSYRVRRQEFIFDYLVLVRCWRKLHQQVENERQAEVVSSLFHSLCGMQERCPDWGEEARAVGNFVRLRRDGRVRASKFDLSR